jgi:hypothetical protein
MVKCLQNFAGFGKNGNEDAYKLAAHLAHQEPSIMCAIAKKCRLILPQVFKA